ncbi:MAG: ABC transporter ATP-binding protein [Opitutales bacterium]|nr:ABC transporter ATP-binding protein [Opitutales bacterium]
MSEPMIHAENLSKRYVLGAFGAASFRDELTDLFDRVVGRAERRNPSSSSNREFWALDKVSFDIEEGDTVGLIGRNGAGKSTLLKILSRITTPTRGKVTMHGKVAALLEVGTGFHPDLTGIENVYLNGAILGMKRWEIRSRLDSILEFSGVGAFADTPVKRYSSGMRVRLAFAVAAHLRQDILIVDEVLAVGDHDFQRKCLGKMGEVARQGRTVIFVSHNMFAVSRLCAKCMYLKDGRLMGMGETREIISEYLRDSMGQSGCVRWEKGFAEPGVEDFALLGIELVGPSGEVDSRFSVVDPIVLRFEFEASQPIWAFQIDVMIRSEDGVLIMRVSNNDDPSMNRFLEAGRHVYELTLPPYRLNEGSYTIGVQAHSRNSRFLFRLEDLLSAEVELIARNNEQLLKSEGLLYPEVEWKRHRSECRVIEQRET